MIYSIKINTEKFPWFVMPISDTCAFILQHQDDYNKYLENDSFSYIHITKDNFIRLLNDFALKEEMNEDSAFIISSQKGKAELERLLKNIVK